MSDPDTLHTYQPSESDLQKGWRLGVMAAWRAAEISIDGTGSVWAVRRAIEALGNAGPPANMGERK